MKNNLSRRLRRKTAKGLSVVGGTILGLPYTVLQKAGIRSNMLRFVLTLPVLPVGLAFGVAAGLVEPSPKFKKGK